MRIGENELKLIEIIVDKLTMEQDPASRYRGMRLFSRKSYYEIYKKDKFVFRLPKEEGFYFNENDVWVYVVGNNARIGVTDFAQKSLSDIMFFTPPQLEFRLNNLRKSDRLNQGKQYLKLFHL